MKRKAMLVPAIGGPKRIVQEIATKQKTSASCPICKSRFKKGEQTILIDLVKQIRLVLNDEGLERSVRVHVCQRCAQPVIERKEKEMKELMTLLAKLVVDDMMKENREI